MDAKQGPFSLYDFLGYFFPGAIAIFAWSFCMAKLGNWTPALDPRAISKWSDLLPFILAAYVCGHVVALISSLTVERYFIWSFSYPSKTLLRYKGWGYLSKLDGVSSVNIARICVWTFLLPISVPVTILCALSSERAGFVAQLDPLLTRMIRRKIAGLIVEQGQIARPNDYIAPREGDFFRLAYHYVLENAPAHLVKMQNYVALFGFNRALCLTFVVLFWISFFAWFFGSLPQASAISFAAGFLANVFFFGFAKFYRRFSLEVLMALAAVFKIPPRMRLKEIPARPSRRVRVGFDLREQPSQVGLLLRAIKLRIKRKRHGIRPPDPAGSNEVDD